MKNITALAPWPSPTDGEYQRALEERLSIAVDALKCIRANWMERQHKVLLLDGADIQLTIDACEPPARSALRHGERR